MTEKTFFTLLAISWVIIIFTFSNTNSTNSNKLSYSVADKVITITNQVKITNINEENKQIIVKKINKPLRKLAHMLEYFILAFIVFNLLTHYNVKKNIYLITFIFCFIYSLTDEYHQLMVEGRNGQFIDCIIDTCGTSIYLIFKSLKDTFMYKFKKNTRQKR